MQSTPLLAPCALACALSTIAVAPAFGQQLRPDGIASVWAVGLSTRGGAPAGGVQDPNLVKAPGNQATPPTPWALATAQVVGSPDYSSHSILGGPAGVLEIDAHSSGNDVIPPPDSLGAPAVNAFFDNWLMFTVSVRETAVGNASSHIGKAKAAGRAVGAELVSFYASGSRNLDASLAGATRVEGTALSLGFDGTTANTADVDALDYGIGVHAHSGGNARSGILFPETNTYYFSITAASATAWLAQNQVPGQNPPHFAVDGTGWAGPRGGDIYKVVRTSNGWGSIQLFKTIEALGLPSDADIDALTVDRTGNVFVFSTVLDMATAPSRPQLLIASPDPNSGSGPHAPMVVNELTDQDPVTSIHTPVVSKLGLVNERDDVDGVCGIDPEGTDFYDAACGTPLTSAAETQYFPAGTPMMGLSLQRGEVRLGHPELVALQLSGWGQAKAQPCEVFLLYYSGPPLSPNQDPLSGGTIGSLPPGWQVKGPFLRGPNKDNFELALSAAAVVDAGYFAAFVLQYEHPSRGGNLLAGSLVSQIDW